MDFNASFSFLLLLFFTFHLSAGSLVQKHCCQIGRKWYQDNAGSCPTHPLSPFYSSSYQRDSSHSQTNPAHFQQNLIHSNYSNNTNPPPLQRNACIISLEICCTTEQRRQRCKVGKQLAMTTKGGSCSAELLKKKLKNVIWVSNEDADVKECCNCCKLGMRARDEGMSCDSLQQSSFFTCQCKQSYRSCCLRKPHSKNNHSKNNYSKNKPHHLTHKKTHHPYNHHRYNPHHPDASKYRYNYKSKHNFNHLNNQNNNQNNKQNNKQNKQQNNINDYRRGSADNDDKNDDDKNDVGDDDDDDDTKPSNSPYDSSHSLDNNDQKNEILNNNNPRSMINNNNNNNNNDNNNNNNNNDNNNDNNNNNNNNNNDNDNDLDLPSNTNTKMYGNNLEGVDKDIDACSTHHCPPHYQCVVDRLKPLCVRLRHYKVPASSSSLSSSSPSSPSLPSSPSSFSSSSSKPSSYSSSSSSTESKKDFSSDLDLKQDEDFNMAAKDKFYVNGNGEKIRIKYNNNNIKNNKRMSERKNAENVAEMADSDDRKCEKGFSFNPVSSACEDIDECSEEGNRACHQDKMMCKNTIGSFKCQCLGGYTFNPRFQKCQDTDECKTNSHDCTATENCFNREGSYQCLSKDGGCARGSHWKIDAGKCEDTNECEQGTHNCTRSQKCINHSPLFACSNPTCEPGFVLEDGECVDIDECLDGSLDTCDSSQICTNTPGSFNCEEKLRCDAGFKLNQALNSCEDIDECNEMKNGRMKSGRGRRQLNGLGDGRGGRWGGSWSGGRSGVSWSGGRGYRKRRGRNANTLNKGLLHNCTQESMVCMNTVGGFECTCEEGFTYDQHTHQCVDVDECMLEDNENEADKNDRKEEKEGEIGVDSTHRDEAQQVGEDNNDREDGEKREDSKGVSKEIKVCPSNSKCLNTRGSYQCECKPGFMTDQHSSACKDIDECSMGIHSCAHECVNTWGSYRCGCSSGFTTDRNDPNKCIDADECKENSHKCGEDGVCVNKEGGYDCASVLCPAGFQRVQRTSENINHETQKWKRHHNHHNNNNNNHHTNHHHTNHHHTNHHHNNNNHHNNNHHLKKHHHNHHNTNNNHHSSGSVSIQSFKSVDQYRKYLKKIKRSARRERRYRMHSLKSYRNSRPAWYRGADKDLRINKKNSHAKTPINPSKNDVWSFKKPRPKDGMHLNSGKSKNGSVYLKAKSKLPVSFYIDEGPVNNGGKCMKVPCHPNDLQCQHNNTQSIHWKLIKLPPSTHLSRQSQPTYPIPIITINPPISKSNHYRFEMIGGDGSFEVVNIPESNKGRVRLLRELEAGGKVELMVLVSEMETSKNHIIHFIFKQI